MEGSTHASSSAPTTPTDLIKLGQEIVRLGTVSKETGFTQEEQAKLGKFFTVNPNIREDVLSYLFFLTEDKEKLNYLKEFLPTGMFLVPTRKYKIKRRYTIFANNTEYYSCAFLPASYRKTLS
jgi:hypothetical protein